MRNKLLTVIITFCFGVLVGGFAMFHLHTIFGSNSQDYVLGNESSKVNSIKNALLKKSNQHCPYRLYLQPYISKEIAMYSDRGYCNKKYNSKFKDMSVLQIPRHFRRVIKFNVNKPIIVYRGITKSNNSSDFDSWEKADLPFEIGGSTCKFDELVKKEFPEGEIELSYGWTSASPILLKYKDGSIIEKLIVNEKHVKNNLGLRKTF